VIHVASGVRVSLSLVDELDAADGQIKSPLLVAQSDTDDTGRYNIIDPGAENIDECRLMAAVGDQNQLTRAFVLSHNTDISVVTEATVRVVLDRLSKAPPVQLCQNFTTSGLQAITDAVSRAVFTATGDNVADINQLAFDNAVQNATVKKSIDNVTGVPVATN
jgi:hypothetical protein